MRVTIDAYHYFDYGGSADRMCVTFYKATPYVPSDMRVYKPIKRMRTWDRREPY